MSSGLETLANPQFIPAGLRTHMLVAASAALLVSLANVIGPNDDRKEE